MEKSYSVFVYDAYACQAGDKYVYGNHDSEEGDEVYFGTSLEDARSAMLSSVSDGWSHVIETKSGLDTVEYRHAELSEWVEEDGELVEGIVIDRSDSLTDDMRAKMKAAERSYWDFLDYREDSYHGIG